MKISWILTFFLSSILYLPIYSDDVTTGELFEKRKEALKKFNYILDDNLLKILLNSKDNPAEGGYRDDKMYIYMQLESFPGEDINYSIGFKSKKGADLDENAFLVFYFNDSELRMISTPNGFTPIKRDYSYNGLEFRKGMTYEFKDNSLSQISCLHKPRNVKTPGEVMVKQYCGDSIFLNSSENVINVIRSGEKCTIECYRYLPVRFPGTYVVTANDVNFRDQPSAEGKILSKLNRDEIVTLLEDTGKHQYFPGSLISATWVKIKTSKEKEGYVHGSFLRAPNEPDIYEIMRKAEEWKKKNGWKDK
jgi:hypothetical protein